MSCYIAHYEYQHKILVMNTIYLHGLECPCTIGVWEWEQHIQQKLMIDIELRTNIEAAATTDQLDDALNYQRVAELVTKLCANSKRKLIEALAEDLASMILGEFAVTSVKIKVDKGGAVPNAKNVGIIIERTCKP